MNEKISDVQFQDLKQRYSNINANIDVTNRCHFQKTSITPCSTPVPPVQEQFAIPGFKKEVCTTQRSHTPSDGRYGCRLCKQLHQRKIYEEGKVPCTGVGATCLPLILQFLKTVDIAPNQTWRSTISKNYIHAYERFFTIVLPQGDPEWLPILQKRALSTSLCRWVSVEGTFGELAMQGRGAEFVDEKIRTRPGVQEKKRNRDELEQLGVPVQKRGRKKKSHDNAVQEEGREGHDDVMLGDFGGNFEFNDEL
jgi:hypothetical protein